MLLGWIPFLGDLLGWVLSWLIWLQNFIIHWIQFIPGGKLDRLTIDYSGMLLIWVLLLVWASWAVVRRKKLIYFSLILTLGWSGIQFTKSILKPTQELTIYKSKAGFVLDYQYGGKLYTWNQGVKAEDLGYLVDPNRIKNKWDRFPNSLLEVTTKENKTQLFPAPVYLDSGQSKLYFASQKPKIIQVWDSGKWLDTSLTDSLKIADSAFRIVF
jgi:competence protein ComEC